MTLLIPWKFFITDYTHTYIHTDTHHQMSSFFIHTFHKELKEKKNS